MGRSWGWGRCWPAGRTSWGGVWSGNDGGPCQNPQARQQQDEREENDRVGPRLLDLEKAYYASLSSGEAYRDRQLTTNFELQAGIFCVPTCFHMRIPKPCLSVRPSVCPSVRTPRKEITIASSISVLH